MTAAPDARSGTGLVWFRRDFRLSDNPAWSAATVSHERVVALFVLDPRLMATSGPFRKAQLLAEVAALDRSLAEVGGRLLIRTGDPAEVVPSEVGRADAAEVYWNADVTPFATARDELVRSRLEVRVSTPCGHLVLPPGSVLTRAGAVARVFGAFHRTWRATTWDPWPDATAVAVADDPGDGPPTGGEDPPVPPGEDHAHRTLASFLEGPVDAYRAGHNAIHARATSELSVHLKFGTISPREVVAAVGDANPDREAFVRQLAWRDWFAHLLAEVPSLTHKAMRTEYDRLEWRDDPEGFDAWRSGLTGFPIVDAGMRELLGTGSMHNRVRMITASFLVKDLLVDWRLGERHFRYLLTDGDVPQNVGNWQWVAGTGPDAAPYFRVFNPVTQSRTYDPRGQYLRRWLPELAGLDDRNIHAPWEAGPLELAAAGVILGADYPDPIVDHRTARLRALDAYQHARHTS